MRLNATPLSAGQPDPAILDPSPVLDHHSGTEVVIDVLLESVADVLLEAGRPVGLHQLLQLHGCSGLRRGRLETLCRELRAQGYLERAVEVARLLTASRETDAARRRLALIAGELAVLQEVVPTAARGRSRAQGGERTVLIVTSRSFPDANTSHARRIYSIAVELLRHGVRVDVVTEPGFRTSENGRHSEDVDGVMHHRTSGPARGEAPADIWLRRFTDELVGVVEATDPDVIVAEPDFHNAVAAIRAVDGTGCPVFYDVAGDWDASWYRRKQDELGWPLPSDLAASSQGLPDRYTLRRRQERAVWSSASGVLLSSRDRALGAEVRGVVGGVPGAVLIDASGPKPVHGFLDMLETVGATAVPIEHSAGSASSDSARWDELERRSVAV